MNKIEKLGDIAYDGGTVIFDATVIDVTDSGDNEKKHPYKFTLMLEGSGEKIQATSWRFENLEIIKGLVNTLEVYQFEGQAGKFGNYGNQIRIGTIHDTGKASTKKVISVVDVSKIKAEITTIINTYIPQTSVYLALLPELILNNNNFWIWPAATKIHHAYQGGLAKHSLNVCKNAINIWKNYSGENCNITLIVAGALLHDIGKLTEYNADGSRTVYGNLIPHSVAGYGMVLDTSQKYGLDPFKNKDLLMLEHVILSHHGKLEFGAPVLPYILEADIVSKADELDAEIETAETSLNNLNNYDESERLLGLDGKKILKWK